MSNADQTHSASSEVLFEQVESLTWALLDEQIEEADAALLAKLLEQSDALRRHYLECVQLHVDLHQHFGGAPQLPLPNVTVLGNLAPGMPLPETRPPVAD